MGARIMTTYMCPICGYDELYDPPKSLNTGAGSYEICPCCGFQFGVTDDDRGYDYDQWRKKWIDEGMPWRDLVAPPAGWDPVKQLGKLRRT